MDDLKIDIETFNEAAFALMGKARPNNGYPYHIQCHPNNLQVMGLKPEEGIQTANWGDEVNVALIDGIWNVTKAK